MTKQERQIIQKILDNFGSNRFANMTYVGKNYTKQNVIDELSKLTKKAKS